MVKMLRFVMVLVVMALLVSPVLAQGEGEGGATAGGGGAAAAGGGAAAAGGGAAATASIGLNKMGAGFGAGLALLGVGLGIGRIGGQAVEGMSRQPEAAGTIQTAMIIAAALIEGAGFFALVICGFLL